MSDRSKYKILNEGQKVKFTFYEITGIGIIRGRQVRYNPLPNLYIIEIVESNIDVNDYPYSCIEVSQEGLELIE